MDTIEAMQKVESAVHYWKHWRDEEWPQFRKQNSDEHAKQMSMLRSIHSAVLAMACVMAIFVGAYFSG